MPRVVPSQVVEVIDKLDLVANEALRPKEAAKITGIVALVDQIPGELLTMSAAEYSIYVIALEQIRGQLNSWQIGSNITERLSPSPLFGGYHAVIFLRDVLSKCPDSSSLAASSDLAFIQDVQLRENLVRDLAAVNEALSNGEWKAATVLSGSLLEALLLWRLAQAPANEIDQACLSLGTNWSSAELERWSLHQYIELAHHLKLINADTALATRLAKEFRNLIHPGRAKRLSQECTRGTALSAVGAVEHVISALS